MRNRYVGPGMGLIGAGAGNPQLEDRNSDRSVSLGEGDAGPGMDSIDFEENVAEVKEETSAKTVEPRRSERLKKLAEKKNLPQSGNARWH
jgi:hypothetical protein